MTKLLFLENTYCYAFPSQILETGKDELGSYFIPHQSIFYFGGGGQPKDFGVVNLTNHKSLAIVNAKLQDNGAVKHYIEEQMPESFLGKQLSITIDSSIRLLNSAYHIVGHWITQVIVENLQLPLYPVKAHHYPNEAYVQFEVCDLNFAFKEDYVSDILFAMQIDRQANLQVNASFVTPEDDLFKQAFLPKNFTPPANKPLRIVKMENYAGIPCGGSHLSSIREIKNFTIKQPYLKNKQLRVPYSVEIFPISIS